MIWWYTQAEAKAKGSKVVAGEPRHEILKANSAFKRWWPKFVSANLSDLAFQYELAARLEKCPDGEYRPRLSGKIEYPFGKAFCFLNDHAYQLLIKSCPAWDDFPRRGYEESEPAIFVTEEKLLSMAESDREVITHVVPGQGGWTKINHDVAIKGKILKPFAVNLRKSTAEIVRSLAESNGVASSRINLPLKKYVDDLREQYGTSARNKNPLKGEQRNLRPWTKIQWLDAYFEYLPRISSESINPAMSRGIFEAKKIYIKFLSSFEDNSEQKTPWEESLITGRILISKRRRRNKDI